ncbi:hypothetical protein AWJ20_4562 [Sugiyamaella lignohabitans]|uniref:Uncharacterized protein n=1 Tax=Sugiyamaella lignohabitans TaxID=796027 RepID=A0A167CIE5_9ASCO|nr:uncharacterized protein AWJ20_4562 [Sugiyamaella lignohabitans]ANB11740.1 hypothetical protein AWJ20_4562 [Sugiyamaella lignohabitans]
MISSLQCKSLGLIRSSRRLTLTSVGVSSWIRRNYSAAKKEHLSKLPLDGVRVLDLSRVLAGPFCTQILADYGADVIKIEQPGVGDETRFWRAAGEGKIWKDEYPLMSLYYASINRNKRSVTVNMKNEKGIEVIKKLARESDILVANFLPGKLESMGLGYEDLKKENPGLIYANITGYGPAGPSKDRAGYDAIALAEAGLLHITGDATGPPSKPGVAIGDLCTGLYAHGAILAALHGRQNTGLGTRIDASLFESALSLLINVGLASINLDLDQPENRRRGKRFGLGHPNLVPYGGFKTKDGKMIFIAANNNRQWFSLCKRINAVELGNDPRFNTNDGRVDNRTELVPILESLFLEKSLQEWLDLLDSSGLPYGALNDVVDALDHPQAAARDMVMTIDQFEAARDGLLRTIGPPVKFDSFQLELRRKPPLLGEHTNEVLQHLGYDLPEIDGLRQAGAV